MAKTSYGEGIDQWVMKYGPKCHVVSDPISGYRFLRVIRKGKTFDIPIGGRGYHSRSYKLSRIDECTYMMEALVNFELLGIPTGTVIVINNAPQHANLNDSSYVSKYAA